MADNMEMRAAFASALAKQMRQHKEILALDADLASASGFNKLFAEFPAQCINCGISEANMIGLACGLSLAGKIPFVHSFAPFLTRRVLDQLFMSGLYQDANLHLFGTDPGYWAAHNGGTHTSVEDIALLRSLPKITILSPSDARQLQWLVEHTWDKHGVYYLRSPRKLLPVLYGPEQEFTLGQACELRPGSEVCIFACGALVHDALAAALELAEQGISCSVVDVFTLKPVDEDQLHAFMAGKKLIVTAENHSKYGGLGSLIAEIMAERQVAAPLRRLAIQDRFGEVGTVEVLKQKYGLDTASLVRSILQGLGQEGN